MKRKFLWAAGALLLAALAFFGLAPGIVENSMNKVTGVNQPLSARAKMLHAKLAIVDMHSDALMWKRDISARSSRGQVDLPRLEQGNFALQIFSSVTKTPKDQNYDRNGGDTDNITALTVAQLQPVRTWTSLVQRSLWHAEKLKRAVEESDGRLRLIQSKGDLAALLADRAAGKKVTGALLSTEGMHNIEGKIAKLQWLDLVGFRMMGLTHFFDNELAGSMHGISHGGLTPFGREAIVAMERRSIIIDVAHLSHKGVAEVLAIAKRPVVSSHGGVQATCKVNRNLTDAEIRGIAKTGGLIGIGYWDGAICSTEPAAIAKAIVHVRDIAGIDHVALGSDFDGAVTTGFDASGIVHVTQALIDAGLSDADIAKVMGGNMIRLLGEMLPER